MQPEIYAVKIGHNKHFLRVFNCILNNALCCFRVYISVKLLDNVMAESYQHIFCLIFF